MSEQQRPLHHAPAVPEEGAHLLDYVNVVLRRWKIALLILLLVFGGVAVKTFLTQPIYEAAVTLEVKKSSKGGMLKELGMESDNSLAADIQILRSRSMAEQVAQILGLDWQIAEAPADLGVNVRELHLPREIAACILELTGADTFRLSTLQGEAIVDGRSGEVLSQGESRVHIDVHGGRSGDRVRIERLPLHEVAGGIKNGIQAVEMGKGTNILRLSYQDTDPGRARDVANALAQAYQRQSVGSKTREAGKTVEFINQQLDGLKTALDQTEQDLQEYKVQSGLVTIGPEGGSLIQKLVSLEQQQADLGLKRKRLEYAIDEVRRALRESRSYDPIVIDTVPLSRESAARLAELEAEKKSLLGDFTEAHPAVLNVQQQIRKAQEALLSAYQAGLRDLQLAERDLATTMDSFEQQLEGIPQAELELAKRTRVNQVNSELYTFLLQKQQEARIAQASTISGVEIIDPAFTPKRPVKPNKQKNLLLGLVLGLMLGIGAVFFLDYLDDSVKDAEEVRNHLGLAVLGIVPRIVPESNEPGGMLISRLAPKSAPVEAFRALRTGLHFAAARDQRKVLMITSSLPNEGKTTISANMAMVLAQSGARVLLLGCDLRNPGLFDLFGTPRAPGLADLLTGGAKKYVHRIPGTSLDLINAGTIPPNPAELLGSERMKKFLDYARTRYDHVVIDAPPVLPVTDAQILAQIVDDVMVVVEPCRVPRKAARRMVESLRAVEANIIGVAMNDKSGKGFKYYGNYGYYGHKYYGSYYGDGEVVSGGLMAKVKKMLD